MPGALSIPCPYIIPVLIKEDTEAQRGHVAHLRVTSEFKERKAALLVVLSSATLASGCSGQEGVLRIGSSAAVLFSV